MLVTPIQRNVTQRISVPECWQNLAMQIPYQMPKPQHFGGVSATREELSQIYTEECARIECFEGEYGRDELITIPGNVMDEYRKYRPTALVRARGLERRLNYGGRIYFKREDGNPSGSHKPNKSVKYFI